MTLMMKYLYGAAYFYIGTFVVLVLADTTQLIEYQLGYGHRPEVGMDFGMLALLAGTIVYYGVFLMVQYGLSRFCSAILEPQYLLPASFAAGMVASFAFFSELDFLVWILYQRDMGTIFLSVFLIELLFLLLNFAIIWRVVNGKKTRASQKLITFLAIILAVILIVYGLPLLIEIGL
jgi:hypothetical protein